MHIIKSVLAIIFALALAGCCTTRCNKVSPTDVVAPATNNVDADIKLAEAASSISQSLTDLNAMEKASAPPINCKTLPYPTSSDMAQLISVDWSGPIEPLLQRVADLCNYKLRVIGMAPAIPVLVTISANNTPAGYVIRDANFQAASKATVLVYPGIQTIELRYAKN